MAVNALFLCSAVPLSQRQFTMAEADKKARTFRKFQFRGVDLDQLLDMNSDQLVELFHARARRRFERGLKRCAQFSSTVAGGDGSPAQ